MSGDGGDAQPPGDKPHEPTPKKLEEARRRGEIPRAPDLTTGIAYLGVAIGLATLGGWAVRRAGTGLAILLDQSDSLAPLLLAPGGQPLAGGLMAAMLGPVAVPIGIGAALVLVALVAQRGIVFAPEKLSPKLSRISPVAVAKQKFGRAGLFDFAKQAVKLLIYGGLLALLLWARRAEILGAVHAAPGQIAAQMGALILDFLWIVTAVALLIGVADWLFQHADHMRQNRMTRQEMMDEMKTAEGDPHLKQARRQRGQAIATNRMLADVPAADVVIVNPAHYAVALKWDRAARGVPICVAKGVDETAAAIRARAAEAGVPIRSDPPTARALHAAVEIGRPIEPDQYRAVAAAIRFADAMRARARAARW